MESRQELTRLEQKKSSQHDLLSKSTSGRSHMAIVDDEAELSKLYERYGYVFFMNAIDNGNE